MRHNFDAFVVGHRREVDVVEHGKIDVVVNVRNQDLRQKYTCTHYTNPSWMHANVSPCRSHMRLPRLRATRQDTRQLCGSPLITPVYRSFFKASAVTQFPMPPPLHRLFCLAPPRFPAALRLPFISNSPSPLPHHAMAHYPTTTA